VGPSHSPVCRALARGGVAGNLSVRVGVVGETYQGVRYAQVTLASRRAAGTSTYNPTVIRRLHTPLVEGYDRIHFMATFTIQVWCLAFQASEGNT